VSKSLLTIFDTLYQSKTGARYPVNPGKDGALLKGLRAIYSDEDIARYMQAFFAIEDDFIAQSGYSIGAFRGCLPKVIAFANRKPRVAKDPTTGIVSTLWANEIADVRPPWVCPHVDQCNGRQMCKLSTEMGRPVKESRAS